MSILSLLADALLLVVLVLLLRDGALARLRARLRRAPRAAPSPTRIALALPGATAITVEHVATRASWRVDLAALGEGERVLIAASGDTLVLTSAGEDGARARAVASAGAGSVLIVFRGDGDGDATSAATRAPCWIVRA